MRGGESVTTRWRPVYSTADRVLCENYGKPVTTAQVLGDRTGYRPAAGGAQRSGFCSSVAMRQFMFAVAILAVVGSYGCQNNNSGNSNITGPTPNLVTETFTGSITQGTTMIHNFTVTNAGYTLAAGFTAISPASVLSLGIGIGVWDPNAQTCGLNQLQNNTATSGSTAVSTTSVPNGTYCARIYNGGGITDPNATVSYTIQVEHY